MEHAQRQKSSYMKALDYCDSAAGIAGLIASVNKGELSREEALISVDGRNMAPYLFEEEGHLTDEQGTSWHVLLGWSDEVRALRIMTYGSGIQDVLLGQQAGAQGLGLLRGESFLQDEYVETIYDVWLQESMEAKKKCYRQRLVNILTERIASLLQALDGSRATFSLLPVTYDQPVYASEGVQDIHLEALFRAMSMCYSQGRTCEVDILITHPTTAIQYDRCHEYITLVAEQTNSHLRQDQAYRIGALLTGQEALELVDHIVRRSDCIVLDCNSIYEEDQPALKNLMACQELIQLVRAVKPQLQLRTSGPFTASNLPLLYLLGMQEVSCPPREIPFMRLAGAQWELLERAGQDYS